VRIGYAPCADDFSAAGDRWRFAGYAARRGLRLERADPARRYDLVVATAAADLPAWSRGRPPGERLVFDLVDAYLAERGPMDLVRGTGKWALGDFGRPALSYRRELRRICAAADAVVCGTIEQAGLIEGLCDNRHVILDMQESAVREVKSDYGLGDTVNLFWEGLPTNLGAFAGVRAALAEIGRERPVVMHLMTKLSFGRLSGRLGRVQTTSRVAGLFDSAYLYEWNEQLVSRVATGCDLAVIPLDLTSPLARGKPENKLLLMWRMGMPTLTAATPAYARAMRAAGVAMTCRDEREWIEALRTVLADEDARRVAAQRGRAYAVGEHDAARICRRWDAVMDSVGYPTDAVRPPASVSYSSP
jgi:hypothetical protein